jgi:putative FmdB family regulatory protein
LPIYEYRCTNSHTFEVLQSMTDDPVTSCTTCGQPVQRVFHPVAVHFKGSGFYTTDYGRQRSGTDSGGEAKPDSKKPESKETASASSDGGNGSKAKSEK